MEGVGITEMMEELKKDNFSVKYHVQDGDSSSKKSVQACSNGNQYGRSRYVYSRGSRSLNAELLVI